MPSDPKDLAEVELFKLLDQNELKEFAAVVETVNVKAGETLFNIGDHGESLYIVKSGEVELFIKDTAGQKIVLKIGGETICLAKYQCSTTGRDRPPHWPC